MAAVKSALRWILTAFLVAIGLGHFVDPDPFVAIVPDALPAPYFLVYLSGAAEIAGGLGLILPATRRLAAWCLIALFIAVFPANVNMALNDLQLGSRALPAWALWGRLPLQLVLIAWAYWYTRPDVSTRPRSAVSAPTR